MLHYVRNDETKIKMYNTSKKIYEILNTNTALKAIVSKISPVVTAQGNDLKFVNYILKEEGPFSKEGKHDYTLIIHSWAEAYDDTLLIADAVKAAFLDDAVTTIFYYKGSEPKYAEEGIYYTESIYTFKN